MSKKRSAKATQTDEYIPSTGDACDEGAARLNVAMKLVLDAQHPAGPENPADDTGGYDLSIIWEILRDVRNMLQKASANDETPYTPRPEAAKDGAR